MTGQEKNVLTGHLSLVTGVAFSPDSLRVVSGSYDKTVRLWSLQPSPGAVEIASGSFPKNTLTCGGISGPVNAVAFSPDGQRVASAGNDNYRADLGCGDYPAKCYFCCADTPILFPASHSALTAALPGFRWTGQNPQDLECQHRRPDYDSRHGRNIIDFPSTKRQSENFRRQRKTRRDCQSRPMRGLQR